MRLRWSPLSTMMVSSHQGPAAWSSCGKRTGRLTTPSQERWRFFAMKRSVAISTIIGLGFGLSAWAAMAGQEDMATLEQEFRDLPIEARRLTGPLFWLHGDESEERLEMYVGKVAEGGNGCFTAESRPHVDWLGEGWFRDLAICLDAAKKHDLKMWIFDEQWWPSQGVGGKVPPRYAAKRLEAAATDVEGPRAYEADGFSGERYVAALAGRVTADGKVEGDSLVDLASHIKDGKLSWQIPAGKWKVMKFTHVQGPALGQNGQLSVDGASRNCVDWFLKTVYQPHYDRFGSDFGMTIPGFFYDEPETRGDWGTELNRILAEWMVDWKKAYVSYKFQLAGEEQIAARYQYLDAFAEAWGRTMYGGMTDWCHKHGVKSFGHFMEHGGLYHHLDFCAGDMMRLQGHSDMGAIDAVFTQFIMGKREEGNDPPIWQTPKLGSSISHVYGKPDDVTMVEIFGARGQNLTYSEMKWWTDHMQVSGVNFMIPHSFNPRSPYDTDCPPYFYNGGYEPRWPLYRVYADYTSRLSLMLTGGRHICPVALLSMGQSAQVGRFVPPEEITTAMQDGQIDCDWLPYEVFERTSRIAGKELQLHQERYKVLVVPPVEVIPYATLLKVKEFFDAGGVVIGYGFLPSKSATLGRDAKAIAALRTAIWGENPSPGLAGCRKNSAGGHSFLLPQKPTAAQLQQVLASAGVRPTLEVISGETNGWLHVLHRQKAGQDVFLVCNQNHQGAARQFKFRAAANGEPEVWDAVRNEVASIPFERIGANHVDFSLQLEPLETALVVFQPKRLPRPERIESDTKPIREPIVVARDPNLAVPELVAEKLKAELKTAGLAGCNWVWFPEGNPAAAAPVATRHFRQTITIPADRKVKRARFVITADNAFELYVNGKPAGSGANFHQISSVDIAKHLQPGVNVLAIVGINGSDTPNPAGLIGRYVIDFEQGEPLTGAIDKNWKTNRQQVNGWKAAEFDDSNWVAAKEVAGFGDAPWGMVAEQPVTLSPLAAADPFRGRFTMPADVDASKCRVCVEMTDLPDDSASIRVNGTYAGGVIGRPLRLDISRHVKAGENAIVIEPLAPKAVRIVVHGSARR
jgi:hypothetical protein